MSDYIKREDALDALKIRCEQLYPKARDMEHVPLIAHFQDAMRVIASLPTFDDVERKHGKWIVSAYELPVGTHCDNCGWAWVDHIDAVKLNPVFSHIKTNYCPNCGARMVTNDV